MTTAAPAARCVEQVGGGLVERVRALVGPGLSAEQVVVVLRSANAAGPRVAARLDRYLDRHPDALRVPRADCPDVLVRLTRALAAAGHEVAQLGCARCGRTDVPLPRRSAAGRCCARCLDTETRRACARCGRIAQPVARRGEGTICRRCYHLDPDVLVECANCGRASRPSARRDDGAPLCGRCGQPRRTCAGCGQSAPVEANGPDGPLCRRCHQRPPRSCGICGRVRPIHVRSTADSPDICAGCYHGPLGLCAACGRERPGHRHDGGAFLCTSCQPRPQRLCVDCGRTRAGKVTGWPIGALCGSCSSRRKRNPAPCSCCGRTRVLVGRTAAGAEICGPCAGCPELDFTCSRCRNPGQIYAAGACVRCVLHDRLQVGLGGPEHGVRPELLPLLHALGAARHPASVLEWLANSPSAALLGRLARDPQPLSHDTLDRLPDDLATRHLRRSLIAAGVLPERVEALSGLQLWLTGFIAELPAERARVIRAFAEWHVLRDARRRAARGRYTAAAAAHDRADIRVAANFLAWLDARGTALSGLTQDLLDDWIHTHPTKRPRLSSFIGWSRGRDMTGPLSFPARPTALPSRFLDEEERDEQLRRCLTDDRLPREVRVVGALIRLYALPLRQITTLTVDRFSRIDDQHAYLTLDRLPVLLPPRLGRLIEEQIEQPRRLSVLPPELDPGPRYLLPGRFPGRPRDPSKTSELMARHGLPCLAARNTAMLDAVTRLPPIVIADLFGVAPNTAERWARYAQDSWSDYLNATRPVE